MYSQRQLIVLSIVSGFLGWLRHPVDNIHALGARKSITFVGFHSGKSPLSGSPTSPFVAQMTCKYAPKSPGFAATFARSDSIELYVTSSFVPVRSS